MEEMDILKINDDDDDDDQKESEFHCAPRQKPNSSSPENNASPNLPASFEQLLNEVPHFDDEQNDWWRIRVDEVNDIDASVY